jgi:hypothetical protein
MDTGIITDSTYQNFFSKPEASIALFRFQSQRFEILNETCKDVSF